MRPVSINMQSPMRAGGLAFRAGAQAQPSVIRDAPHSDGYSIQRPVKPLSPAQVSTWMRFLCWLGGDSSIAAARCWCGHLWIRETGWLPQKAKRGFSSPFVIAKTTAAVLSGLPCDKRRAARAENSLKLSRLGLGLDGLKQLHDLLFEGLRRLHRATKDMPRLRCRHG